MAREPAKNLRMLNGGLISTTDQPALSIGTEDGQSIWIDLDDDQVWSIVASGIYYLQRRRQVSMARKQRE